MGATKLLRNKKDLLKSGDISFSFSLIKESISLESSDCKEQIFSVIILMVFFISSSSQFKIIFTSFILPLWAWTSVPNFASPFLSTQRESKNAYAYTKVICKTNIARSKRKFYFNDIAITLLRKEKNLIGATRLPRNKEDDSLNPMRAISLLWNDKNLMGATRLLRNKEDDS